MRILPGRFDGGFHALGLLRGAMACVASLAVAVQAAPDPDQPTPQRAMCALLKACQLSYQSPTCTEALSEPVKSVTYDSNYCGWVRGFERRGIVPDGKLTYEVYRYMGTKYRVHYAVADTLDVPFGALDHLIGNIPVTAKLINQYRGTTYTAEYPNVSDSSFFKGSNGSNLTGQATVVWARPDHRERIFYGVGRVKVLSWAMRGNVIIEMKAWPHAADPRRSVYTLRFTMFPVSGFINSVMNLGVFRSVALGKIQDILTDIRLASEAYATKQPPKTKVDYTPGELRALAEFERLYLEGRAP